jgi:hypothetical protein
MKELAKASESEKPIHSDKKDNVKQEIEFYSIRISNISCDTIYFHSKTTIGDNYANLYFHTVGCSVFHPPAKAA